MSKMQAANYIKAGAKKIGWILLNLFLIIFWIFSMPVAFAYFTWLGLGRVWEVAFFTSYFWGGFWLVSWNHVFVLGKVLNKNMKEL